MTDNPITWVIASLEVVMALGIAVFWITWLRQKHDEPWLPPGYTEHEFPFVFTDALLASLLIAGAVLQVLDQPAGESIGLIAAGMLMFLGILDLAYFARTGMFKREHEGPANIFVVTSALLLSVILIVRFF